MKIPNATKSVARSSLPDVKLKLAEVQRKRESLERAVYTKPFIPLYDRRIQVLEWEIEFLTKLVENDELPDCFE